MIERYWIEPLKSLWQEEAKWQRILKIELAVLEFLHEKGLIPLPEWKEIQEKATFSLSRMAEIEAKVHHDVIAFITNVEENIGPAGRWIHYGLTSCDVLDTGLSLALQEALRHILSLGEEVLSLFSTLARENQEILIMGRTHGVHAEPMSLGFKFFGFHQELKRRLDLIKRTKEICRVGKISGAVGMNLFYSKEEEKRILGKLGLRPALDATQVIPRDLFAQVSTALALLAGSLERFAQEIRLLHQTEISEIREGFGPNQRGSSAMPHKKNPILCERICGLARIVRSLSFAQQETMALWHERDLTNSSVERITLPDQTSLIYYMLHLSKKILNSLEINYNKIEENLFLLGESFLSGYALNQLVKRGSSRNEAYGMIQQAVHQGDLSHFWDSLNQKQDKPLEKPDLSLFWKESKKKIEEGLKL
ncbi:MAG: adenylosuccinate lyase [Planctomycetota bacterium]|nr:MAG: adenylosuccinate lyase [Planctomycetota bacterium]